MNQGSVKILIEPSDARGFKQVAVFNFGKDKLAEKSEKAVDSAMDVIQNMAHRIHLTVQNIDKNRRPDKVEVQFGIKFDADLDIIIARAGLEASIGVKLNWGI